MEVKKFDKKYTLKAFFADELLDLLNKEFPYLQFVPNEGHIGVWSNGSGMDLEVEVLGINIVHTNKKSWTPTDNVVAFKIIREIVLRDASLAYAHMKQEMKRLEEKLDAILTHIMYSPGSIGYEEAKKDFESRI